VFVKSLQVMPFCKAIKEKYSPIIQKGYPHDFEGRFITKGKVCRRIFPRTITTIEQAEEDLNKWLITYDNQIKYLNQIQDSLFKGFSPYNPI
jgi:hypothetical protein